MVAMTGMAVREPDMGVAAYVEALYQLAKEGTPDTFTPITYLYRNRNKAHWDKCGVAEAAEEQIDCGHVRTHPLAKGRADSLRGIFLCASLFKGDLPTISHFGDTRKVIPASALLDGCRLYFSDYYCWQRANPQRAHFVTIVVTLPRSRADDICRAAGLRELPPTDNPWLRRVVTTTTATTGTIGDWVWKVCDSESRNRRPWLEIFYAHAIPMDLYEPDPREGHPGNDYKMSPLIRKGLRAYGKCPRCNLKTESPPAKAVPAEVAATNAAHTEPARTEAGPTETAPSSTPSGNANLLRRVLRQPFQVTRDDYPTEAAVKEPAPADVPSTGADPAKVARAGATPSETAPSEEEAAQREMAPIEVAATEDTPAGTAPFEATQTKADPTKYAPARDVSTKAAPKGVTLTEVTPVEAAPIEVESTRIVSTAAASTKESPSVAVPTETAPLDVTLIDVTPAEGSLTEDAPKEAGPMTDALTVVAPAGAALAEVAPTESPPIEATPTEPASVDISSTDASPAKTAPTAESGPIAEADPEDIDSSGLPLVETYPSKMPSAVEPPSEVTKDSAVAAPGETAQNMKAEAAKNEKGGLKKKGRWWSKAKGKLKHGWSSV